MSFAARLVHSLAIVTPTSDVTVTEYGQPVAGEPLTVEVQGLIQPKSTREMALVSQAGAMVSDHTIYLQPRDLSGAAYIRREPDDGDRFEITGIRSYEFGRTPHLEVDCRRVVSEVLAVAGS